MSVYIFSGFVLDLLLGDPAWIPHPVRLLGKLISRLEAVIRSLVPRGGRGLKAAGVILALVTVGFAYGATWVLLQLALAISPWLYAAGSVLFIYFALAARSLADEAGKVYRALEEGDCRLARRRLSHIVGRDTGNLDEEGIIRAAVETVAENTVDGVIAPLFYIFLGGPALGMAYKAVNTLDSMVGYLNERYRDLGWASARLDDLANWLPARITGLLMPIAGGAWGKDARRAFRIYRRDRLKHKSPNSGHPEAVMAGLLGVRLGGTNYYGGQAVEKPVIGDAVKPLEPADILEASRIMKTTAVLGILFFYAVALKFGFR
ncbi:MAG: adenosylcobinamide-phosphate synthase CbiB [Peptococcaceae bacterium]|jgi:adenosylcobinamide-phosphate synthase|nr:adenosylcobinamide-phosphate synthase CbiB [Peptococcaceae bacterium]MDH7525795.1 adenosylcobinamide-phosphate synthase CbiB [Peptococcaceae bacterium]